MYKVTNPMGCTPDKVIRSHYNLLLCLVLRVLYVCTTSTSLQITSHFIYSYLRAVFHCIIFCIASKITIREGICCFKLLSLNVRRITSAKKRKALIMWLNEWKYDFIFLQETYCTVEIEDTWRTHGKASFFFLHTVPIIAVE